MGLMKKLLKIGETKVLSINLRMGGDLVNGLDIQ